MDHQRLDFLTKTEAYRVELRSRPAGMRVEPAVKRLPGRLLQAHPLRIFADEPARSRRAADHHQPARVQAELERDRGGGPAQRVPEDGVDLRKARRRHEQ